MTRNFTVWDGLFLLFLYIKLTSPEADFSWIIVFSPYVLEVIFSLLMTWFKVTSPAQKIIFKIAMWQARREAAAANKLTREYLDKQSKKQRVDDL